MCFYSPSISRRQHVIVCKPRPFPPAVWSAGQEICRSNPRKWCWADWVRRCRQQFRLHLRLETWAACVRVCVCVFVCKRLQAIDTDRVGEHKWCFALFHYQQGFRGIIADIILVQNVKKKKKASWKTNSGVDLIKHTVPETATDHQKTQKPRQTDTTYMCINIHVSHSTMCQWGFPIFHTLLPSCRLWQLLQHFDVLLVAAKDFPPISSLVNDHFCTCCPSKATDVVNVVTENETQHIYLFTLDKYQCPFARICLSADLLCIFPAMNVINVSCWSAQSLNNLIWGREIIWSGNKNKKSNTGLT